MQLDSKQLTYNQGCRSRPFFKFPAPTPAPDKFWLRLLPLPPTPHPPPGIEDQGCGSALIFPDPDPAVFHNVGQDSVAETVHF